MSPWAYLMSTRHDFPHFSGGGGAGGSKGVGGPGGASSGAPAQTLNWRSAGIDVFIAEAMAEVRVFFSLYNRSDLYSLPFIGRTDSPNTGSFPWSQATYPKGVDTQKHGILCCVVAFTRLLLTRRGNSSTCLIWRRYVLHRLGARA